MATFESRNLFAQLKGALRALHLVLVLIYFKLVVVYHIWGFLEWDLVNKRPHIRCLGLTIFIHVNFLKSPVNKLYWRKIVFFILLILVYEYSVWHIVEDIALFYEQPLTLEVGQELLLLFFGVLIVDWYRRDQAISWGE